MTKLTVASLVRILNRARGKRYLQVGQGARIPLLDPEQIAECRKILDKIGNQIGHKTEIDDPDAVINMFYGMRAGQAAQKAQKDLPSVKDDREEERKKDTAEVGSVSDCPSEDSQLHGGDGNSGEVDHAATTRAEKERTAQNDPNSGSAVKKSSPSTALKASERGKSTGGATGGAPEGSGEDHPSEGASGTLTSGPAEEKHPTGENQQAQPAGGDRPECDVRDEAETASEPDGVESGMDATEYGTAPQAPADQTDKQTQPLETPAQEAVETGDVSSPRGNKNARRFGGYFAPEIIDPSSLSSEERRAGKEVKRALQRLIRKVISGYDVEIPRLDARKLAREVVSGRYNLARARKKAGERPWTVLICDGSGSCSAVCKETLRACYAIAEEDDRVILLPTSNSVVWQGYGMSTPLITDYLASNFKDEEIGLVVVFGDSNGAEEYAKLLDDGAKLVWLDSYLCSMARVGPASKSLRSIAGSWKYQPFAWYQAVNSAQTAAIALRDAAKKS